MDTNQKMDRMLCEKALELYRAIEAAVESGRGGYAKEKLTELKSFLQSQMQHSAFRSAHASLPRASTNLSEWKSDLADTRLSVERLSAGNWSVKPEIHLATQFDRQPDRAFRSCEAPLYPFPGAPKDHPGRFELPVNLLSVARI